jgi:hypothetical protein
MKKFIFALFTVIFVLAAGKVSAQAPICNNDNALEGRINAIENQGWRELSREFVPILYFAIPETPYAIGTLRITFGAACDPGDPCPAIALLYQEVAIAQTDKVCIWHRVNP